MGAGIPAGLLELKFPSSRLHLIVDLEVGNTVRVISLLAETSILMESSSISVIPK